MIPDEPAAIRSIFFIGGIIFFLIFEWLAPYRTPSASKPKRWGINFSITMINNIVLTLLFTGMILKTADYVTENRVGVLNMVDIPRWAKIVITVVFLDFMLYIWHLLNHEVPFLWRFHRVHHSDLNMDVSTATRFHIGELAVSALIKISLIYFLGAEFIAVIIFETALVLCAQFHHSSLRVPGWFESIFRVFFVPPSMHRIHHSVVIKERNSNYGTIFSLWDRGLETLVKNVDQDGIRIGVGAYRDPAKLQVHHLLAMPFTKPVR